MFFYSGYIQWGNFGFPLKINILNSLNSLTWDPFLNNGTPILTPWITLFGNLNNASIILFGGLWNMNVAVKLYLFLSTFFMGYSFYILSGSFAQSLISRGSAVVLILTNPLSLQLIGQGDPFQFIIWGVYFLGLFLIYKSSRVYKLKNYIYIFVSVILLSITVAIPQIFYLGVVLYMIFIFYFFILDKERQRLNKIKEFFKILVVALCFLVLLSMPLILTTLFGAFDLSPTSSVANPLNNYIFYSASYFNILLMNSYPSFPITAMLGKINIIFISNMWSLIIAAFISIIFASGVIFRDRKMLFLELIVLLAALFGSGYSSPISPINIYLYTHMFGYQTLNTSYYWEWIIIIPLYSILAGMLLDHLIHIGLNKGDYISAIIIANRNINPSEVYVNKHKIILEYSSKLRKVTLMFVLVAIVLIVSPPLIGQGFYGGGNTGIHADNVPTSYTQLAQTLEYLVGNSSVGVAYFTPNNYVYFGNNTNGVSQPLLINPGVRSPGIPGYLATPVVSNDFSYYLYSNFYLNKTQYIAELFSIMGIKYFVTLNGVVSASSLLLANSKDPTKLMQHQKDVKLLYSSVNYSIFESTLDISVANSVNGFTLFSSNYNVLMDAAGLGLNLSESGPVFMDDINSSNFNFFLSNTINMILLNPESLTTLAIDKFTNSRTNINPLAYTNNYYYSPNEGWMSSIPLETGNLNYILSDPYPFAITSKNISMSAHFTVNGTGNYTIWTKALLAQPDSQMQFAVDGFPSLTINESGNLNPEGFQWVRMPFHANRLENTVNITSLKGLNGIQRIVIVKSGSVEAELARLKQFIKYKNISVLYLNNSGAIQLLETRIYPLTIELTNTQDKSSGTFQQVVTVPKTYYYSKANYNLSNVQWQYSNGTLIPSWLQSYNNTSATWWLRISYVPAFGHLNILMVFYSKATNVLNSETTGISPLLNPKYNDGPYVFPKFNSSGLIGSGTNQYYPTNSGLFFYGKFYDPTGIPGNQAIAGWILDGGSYTPLFAALSNTSYVQPFYFINQSNYLSPKIPDGNYYLFGTSIEYPEAYWYINETVVQTANSSSFANYSGTYVRPTGVSVSVLYSFMSNLPPNNVMLSVSFQNSTNLVSIISSINKNLTSQTPAKIVNNPNGYTIMKISSNITIIRYGYFSGMIETVKGFQVYSILGGLNFILVSSGKMHTANFVSIDYKLLLYGVSVYVVTIIVPTVYFVSVFIRNRKINGRK